MKRELTDEQIDEVLASQMYGHLGMVVKDEQYIVPMTYAYRDDVLYFFTYDSKKLQALQENPNVCFQVEDLGEEHSWKSVIVWGQFEELTNEEKNDAMTVLMFTVHHNRLENKHSYIPFKNMERAIEAAENDEDATFFRVRIGKKTGRFEQP